jgi:hypothetical protein
MNLLMRSRIFAVILLPLILGAALWVLFGRSAPDPFLLDDEPWE